MTSIKSHERTEKSEYSCREFIDSIGYKVEILTYRRNNLFILYVQHNNGIMTISSVVLYLLVMFLSRIVRFRNIQWVRLKVITF